MTWQLPPSGTIILISHSIHTLKYVCKSTNYISKHTLSTQCIHPQLTQNLIKQAHNLFLQTHTHLYMYRHTHTTLRTCKHSLRYAGEKILLTIICFESEQNELLSTCTQECTHTLTLLHTSCRRVSEKVRGKECEGKRGRLEWEGHARKVNSI